MMVQMQIPLTNRKKSEQNWKISLAEKLTGRPLGSFGDPEDIAEAAAFLASQKYVLICIFLHLLSKSFFPDPATCPVPALM